MFSAKHCAVLLFIYTITLSLSDDVTLDSLSVWLYDDLDTDDPINLIQANLSEVDIDTSKPTAFLCHGWIADIHSFWYAPTIKGLLEKGNNVLAADWSNYSKSSYFFESAPDTNPVGEAFADLVLDLHDNLGLSLDSFHCIGHSLGAHVCGFLGQKVSLTISEKINRITGLDPAGPDFNLASDCHRLSKDDANLVDVIHTMAGTLGIIESVGHIDFWPNGGVVQPVSCSGTLPQYFPFCSHSISTTYYIESINSFSFIATKCSSYLLYSFGICSGNTRAIMGENVNPTQRGNFYLNTNIHPPYAQGWTLLT